MAHNIVQETDTKKLKFYYHRTDAIPIPIIPVIITQTPFGVTFFPAEDIPLPIKVVAAALGNRSSSTVQLGLLPLVLNGCEYALFKLPEKFIVYLPCCVFGISEILVNQFRKEPLDSPLIEILSRSAVCLSALTKVLGRTIVLKALFIISLHVEVDRIGAIARIYGKNSPRVIIIALTSK
jgi:hypothetical protein